MAFAALLFLSSTLADKAVEKTKKKSAVVDIKKVWSVAICISYIVKHIIRYILTY